MGSANKWVEEDRWNGRGEKIWVALVSDAVVRCG
jgi:hypothetical protein